MDILIYSFASDLFNDSCFACSFYYNYVLRRTRLFSEERANQSAFAGLTFAGQLRAMDAFAASPPAPFSAGGVTSSGVNLAPVPPGHLAFVANEVRQLGNLTRAPSH